MVKRLRHRPFTAVTRVRVSVGSPQSHNRSHERLFHFGRGLCPPRMRILRASIGHPAPPTIRRLSSVGQSTCLTSKGSTVQVTTKRNEGRALRPFCVSRISVTYAKYAPSSSHLKEHKSHPLIAFGQKSGVFCLIAVFGRGAPAARVRLPVAFVNADARGKMTRPHHVRRGIIAPPFGSVGGRASIIA